MRNLTKLSFMLLFFILNCGSSSGIPDSKKNYIGTWKSSYTILQILENGSVNYKSEVKGYKKSVNGPIGNFSGDNFNVNILLTNIDFKVSKAPYQVDGLWKMVVNGEELIKISEGSPDIPSRDNINQMINIAVLLVDESNKKDDFKIMYNGISQLWQAQTTDDELKNIFKVFKPFDLRKYLKKSPQLTKDPYIDKDQLLIFEGYYPDQNPLKFNLKYIYESPNWKIVGIHLKI